MDTTNHENIIQNKSYAFAIKIVYLYKALAEQKKEFVLGRQILKSGTSIGANVEEALGAQSKRDFIAKLFISYKESRETIYWLKILRDTHYINSETATLYLNEAEEITKIITKILKTMKKRYYSHYQLPKYHAKILNP